MFYDEVFQRITENSPFSVEATLTVTSGETSSEYTLKGIFYSGNYGETKLDKGYTLMKTLKKQSFQISLSSLPEGLDAAILARQTLSVNGETWWIDEVVGNASGMLTLALKRA